RVAAVGPDVGPARRDVAGGPPAGAGGTAAAGDAGLRSAAAAAAFDAVRAAQRLDTDRRGQRPARPRRATGGRPADAEERATRPGVAPDVAARRVQRLLRPVPVA